MKLLILAGIIYLCYRAVKRWLIQQGLSPGPDGGYGRSSQVDDLMVKDPQCETYFPRREGVHLRLDGHDYHFCSVDCRDRFLASRKKKP